MSKKISEIYNDNIKWQDLTSGCDIYAGGTSKEFKTGDWRTDVPVFVEENCKQCLLCIPVCPDSAIPLDGAKRLEFDFDHCKGCGICAKVCPFNAIKMIKEEK